MTRRFFIFDGPDRFVPGAVGEPGDRSFYLQARKGDAVVSVGLEKTQVAALATRLEDLLDAVDAPAETAAGELGLEEPIVELFRVGAMALAWDPETEAIVIEAQTPTEDGEYVELPDDAEEGPDLLRVRIDANQARSFVRQAEALVAAGRPACPFCGQPLDPGGHFCPRGNGHLN
ncbi:MAG TPA: DUF3090 domain-containing protein [Candidatus Limnocylindria bacterium]|nr:DUF3090 domain-containing protein [Candidatus Limnocylindria bacterium]